MDDRSLAPTREATRYVRERERMVQLHLAARGIEDPEVLGAMADVPREAFVPPELAPYAYVDRALPIGEGQTISQPYVVAMMAELAEVKPRDRVLEVGTGSGYAAAVLGRIAREVFTVERHASLAAEAERRFRRLATTTSTSPCATAPWAAPSTDPTTPSPSRPAGRARSRRR